jgi:predicted ester cyclase
MTLTDDNRELRRRFWAEAFKDVGATVDEHIHPAWIDHDAAPDQPPGSAGYKWLLRRLQASFPDISFTQADVIADGDRVATLWTLEGTHTGLYRDLAPTGRGICVAGIQVDRLEDRRVVESWNHSSSESIRAQLTGGDKR